MCSAIAEYAPFSSEGLKLHTLKTPHAVCKQACVTSSVPCTRWATLPTAVAIQSFTSPNSLRTQSCSDYSLIFCYAERHAYLYTRELQSLTAPPHTDSIQVFFPTELLSLIPR